MAKKTIEIYRPATKAELKKNPLHTNVIDRVEEIDVPDEAPDNSAEALRNEIDELKKLLKDKP